MSNTPRRFSASRSRITTRGLRIAVMGVMIPALILSTATPSTAMYASFRATLARVELFFGGMNMEAERASEVPRKMTRQELWAHVQQESLRQHVPANLVWGLIAAGSNFDQDARSPSGAIGLMQIMPGTAKEYKLANIEDPHQNVSGGIQYFRILLAQYDGEVPLAIAAYRFGPGAVHKSQPPSATVGRFVNSVLEFSNSDRTRAAAQTAASARSRLLRQR